MKKKKKILYGIFARRQKKNEREKENLIKEKRNNGHKTVYQRFTYTPWQKTKKQTNKQIKNNEQTNKLERKKYK